jgi:hypothetical protein
MPVLPANFGTSNNGDLYRLSESRPGKADLVRRNYLYPHAEIGSVADLKATLRSGGYSWPGGYPLYFVTADGAALSFDTVRREFLLVVDAIRRRDNTGGWRVIGSDVNWEDDDLTDAHTGERIESAYGEET